MHTESPRRMSRGLLVGLVLASALSVTAISVLGVFVVSVLRVSAPRPESGTPEPGPSEPGRRGTLGVREGQAFTFHEQHVYAGWRVQETAGTLRPTGVRFEGTDRSDLAETGYLTFRFYHQGQLATVSRCASADTLEPGSANEFRCRAVATPPQGWDRIEVSDFQLSF